MFKASDAVYLKNVQVSDQVSDSCSSLLVANMICEQQQQSLVFRAWWSIGLKGFLHCNKLNRFLEDSRHQMLFISIRKDHEVIYTSVSRWEIAGIHLVSSSSVNQSPLDAECSLSLCESKHPGFGMSFGNTVKVWVSRCLGVSQTAPDSDCPVELRRLVQLFEWSLGWNKHSCSWQLWSECKLFEGSFGWNKHSYSCEHWTTMKWMQIIWGKLWMK